MLNRRYRGCKISTINSYLPECKLTNSDLESEFPDFFAKKIKSKVGIESRHIASKKETALDLAKNAIKKLFSNKPEAKEADFLIFCTQSPEYFLPSGACILQHYMGMRTDIGAFDYNLGCSGFVYGLAMAKSLIQSAMANKVLIVTSETYTKYISKSDKGNRSIFGDAATATLIECCEENSIDNFIFGTDGSGAENLIVKNGAMHSPKDSSAGDFLYMNGPEIFNFTIEKVPELCQKVLQKGNLTKDDIDYFCFHQANKYMLDYLRIKSELPEEKFYIDMSDTGNTVSSSIPLLLEKMAKKNFLNTPKKILLAGFGVGYSYAGCTIDLSL
ncbi:MAG: ketoacyl-ACP synthase III [Lentisphaeria bacterium]|nr:ketoacyl-ACP synthase III [Lentisphaeria bacterium]